MVDVHNTSENDIRYMQRAVALASLGSGWVNPNPQVGAVIVKDGQIIGEGYHRRFGGLHAERNAIISAEASLCNATMYVTLEPCCHTGKTSPCTEAIIRQGLSRVVDGSDVPNPNIAGKGIAQLREAGIEVVTNFLQEECDKLNEIFFHYIQTGLPYVLMKYAMTLDGKIATRTGASKWVTGEAAREDVHRLRGRYAAIMVGIGTVLADDPLLNCRLKGGHNPLRVICDSALRIPIDSQIVRSASEQPTLIVTTTENPGKAALLETRGCEVLILKSAEAMGRAGSSRAQLSLNASASVSPFPRVDLKLLMQTLGEREIDSVLIEGGPTLHGTALEAGIVNKVRCYIAPKLFGGSEAFSPIAGLGVETPVDALNLTDTSLEIFGADYCIEGKVG